MEVWRKVVTVDEGMREEDFEIINGHLVGKPRACTYAEFMQHRLNRMRQEGRVEEVSLDEHLAELGHKLPEELVEKARKARLSFLRINPLEES